MKMKRITAIFLAAAMTVFVVACSNYRLAGTPTRLPFKSVYVKPVKNSSYAAQSTNALTNAISDSINQVSGLHTALEGEAQAVLTTTLIDYQRRPVATSATDTALAASYMMTATAECTLERPNGEVIFKNRKIKAQVMLYPGSSNDVLGNEYQNMPVLMRELGGKIKDAVIGIW